MPGNITRVCVQSQKHTHVLKKNAQAAEQTGHVTSQHMWPTASFF